MWINNRNWFVVSGCTRPLLPHKVKRIDINYLVIRGIIPTAMEHVTAMSDKLLEPAFGKLVSDKWVDRIQPLLIPLQSNPCHVVTLVATLLVGSALSTQGSCLLVAHPTYRVHFHAEARYLESISLLLPFAISIVALSLLFTTRPEVAVPVLCQM